MMYSKKVFRCNTSHTPHGYWIGYAEGDCFIPLGYKSNNSGDIDMMSGIRLCDEALKGASFKAVTKEDIPIGIMSSLGDCSYSYSRKESTNPLLLQEEDIRNLCHLILIHLDVEFVKWVVHSAALGDIARCFEKHVKSFDDFAVFYWITHLLTKRDKTSIVTLSKRLPQLLEQQLPD